MGRFLSIHRVPIFLGEKNAMPTPGFLFQQLDVLELHIRQINEFLASTPELRESKVQALHRLQIQKVRLYADICKKNAPEEKHAEEIPIPPDWISDPLCFAHEALRVTLYNHQRQFCEADRRVNILIAGRGAGKSLAACVIAIRQAFFNPRHTVLVVSSGQRMSSDFGIKILDLLRDTPIHRWVASISNTQVAFHNGSVINLLPANPDTIRGYHPKSPQDCPGITVILDEACFMDQGDDIRKAVEYALITTDKNQGRLYIVSSPSTTGSWVYAYTRKADEPGADTLVIQCPSTANPAISPEEIERLRKTKNELEFRAEVLGEWVDGAYGLFTGCIESNILLADPPEPPADAHYALGADLALSYSPTHDRNALAVVARWFPDNPDNHENGLIVSTHQSKTHRSDSPGRTSSTHQNEPLEIEPEPRYRLMEMCILDHASDRELRTTLRRLVERYGIEQAAVEQYQGKGLSEYGQTLGLESQLIAPTPGTQQTIFHELHRLLRQNLLELPSTLPELFFEELQTFEYKREANGRISFGHPPGLHDDTVYALAWAIHAAQAELYRPEPVYIPPIIQFFPDSF